MEVAKESTLFAVLRSAIVFVLSGDRRECASDIVKDGRVQLEQWNKRWWRRLLSAKARLMERKGHGWWGF